MCNNITVRKYVFLHALQNIREEHFNGTFWREEATW